MYCLLDLSESLDFRQTILSQMSFGKCQLGFGSEFHVSLDPLKMNYFIVNTY